MVVYLAREHRPEGWDAEHYGGFLVNLDGFQMIYVNETHLKEAPPVTTVHVSYGAGVNITIARLASKPEAEAMVARIYRALRDGCSALDLGGIEV